MKNIKRSINYYLAPKHLDDRIKLQCILSSVINERSKKGKSLKFIQYWGGSNKEKMDKFDFAALSMTFAFIKSIKEIYQIDIELTIIFTDTHVLLNGYSIDKYYSYCREIQKILHIFNYKYMYMSEVLIPYFKLTSNSKSTLIKTVITESKKTNSFHELEMFKLDSIISILKNSAIKHCSRFSYQSENRFQFNSIEQAVLSYIKLNHIEVNFLKMKFPNTIMLTYSSENEINFLLPEMKSIQIFSYQKGNVGRPWFTTEITIDSILEYVE